MSSKMVAEQKGNAQIIPQPMLELGNCNAWKKERHKVTVTVAYE